jgi:HlyD family secretion protein
MSAPMPGPVRPFQVPHRLLSGGSRRRRGVILLGIPATALLALLAGLVRPIISRSQALGRNLLVHPVHYQDVERSATEPGTLEAIQNRDVVCRVKSRIVNSTFASTIQWLIDEGTLVKRGEVVAVLDRSAFEEDLGDQRVAVLKARSDWDQAEENCKIIASQNAADLQNARFALDLAALDLEKYRKGDYAQLRQDVESRRKMAEADVEAERERTAWSQRMLRKGFAAVTQVQSDQNRLHALEFDLVRIREEERVLEDFTHQRTLTELEAGVLKARADLERVKHQNLARLTQAHSDRRAKRSVLEVEERRYRFIEEQIAACTLRAPQDGLVVYYSSDQSRRTQQGLVAPGEPVREGQRLMQIPDLRHLMVDVSLPEAVLAEVREGDPAVIEVHAFPNRLLHGHVKRIAEIPSELDWWMTARKIYHTEVWVDDGFAALRPGMRAEVKILTTRPARHVLAVPVDALLEPVGPGEQDKCYVLTPDGPEERLVTVGLSNDLIAEVRQGLQEGEEVVTNPRALQEEREPAVH